MHRAALIISLQFEYNYITDFHYYYHDYYYYSLERLIGLRVINTSIAGKEFRVHSTQAGRNG